MPPPPQAPAENRLAWDLIAGVIRIIGVQQNVNSYEVLQQKMQRKISRVVRKKFLSWYSR